MKKITLLFIITLIILIPKLGISQCQQFTMTKAVPLLEEYILSGRYHSIKLQEGEEILILKTS